MASLLQMFYASIYLSVPEHSQRYWHFAQRLLILNFSLLPGLSTCFPCVKMRKTEIVLCVNGFAIMTVKMYKLMCFIDGLCGFP